MSRHDYAVLTIRVFALYVWFCALQYLTNGALEAGAFYHDLRRGNDILPYYLFVALFIPAAVNAVLGFILFKCSVALGRWLMPRAGEPEGEPPPPHPLAAASVAFGAVGVAIFLHGLPGLLNPVLTYFQGLGDPNIPRPPMPHMDEVRLIVAAVQMVLGFVLFLKARVFAAVWWRKQQAGA